MNNLNQIAHHLAGNHQPEANLNSNVIINEIPGDLPVEHNGDSLMNIISGMLGVVVKHARNAAIRLSARKYGYIIVLEIAQDGSGSCFHRDIRLQQVSRLAESLGGSLHIVSKPTQLSEVLSLSFPNLPQA